MEHQPSTLSISPARRNGSSSSAGLSWRRGRSSSSSCLRTPARVSTRGSASSPASTGQCRPCRSTAGAWGGRAVVHRALLRVHDVRRASGQRAALPHAAASCVPHRHRLCQLVRGERRGSSTVRARAHVRPGGLDGGYCGQRAGFRDRVRGAAKKRCPLLVKARVSHRSDGGACFPMGDFVADVLIAVLRQQEARCRGKGIRQFRDDG